MDFLYDFAKVLDIFNDTVILRQRLLERELFTVLAAESIHWLLAAFWGIAILSSIRAYQLRVNAHAATQSPETSSATCKSSLAHELFDLLDEASTSNPEVPA